MIHLLDRADILKDFLDICGIKLRSLAISYGFGRNFCTFWYQINDMGEITAVIGKFGSAVTVSHKSADMGELSNFIRFIGFSELVCSQSLARLFGDSKAELINSVEKQIESEYKFLKELTYLEFREIYDILESYGGEAVTLGDFEDWYVDISHRIRHGGAIAVLSEQGCGISLLTEDACIINGIAVKTEYRGKGYGRELLVRLGSAKPVTRSLAFCLDSELPFYKKCGYSFVSKYSLISKGK